MKRWQDKIIMIIGILFGFMLIPMVIDSLNGNLVNPISSGLTATGAYILAYCFYTLDLKLSTISSLFTGFVWTLLFILGLWM